MDHFQTKYYKRKMKISLILQFISEFFEVKDSGLYKLKISVKGILYLLLCFKYPSAYPFTIKVLA